MSEAQVRAEVAFILYVKQLFAFIVIAPVFLVPADRPSLLTG